MRVFLRNKADRLYCAGQNAWVTGIGQALEFNSVPQAAKFAFEGNLPESEIIIRCDLLEEEVAMPLLPEWCEFERPNSAAA